MKLMCVNHGRRAMVLPSAAVIHRSDGRTCDGMVNLGHFTGSGSEVLSNRRYADTAQDLLDMDEYLWERPGYME